MTIKVCITTRRDVLYSYASAFGIENIDNLENKFCYKDMFSCELNELIETLTKGNEDNFSYLYRASWFVQCLLKNGAICHAL